MIHENKYAFDRQTDRQTEVDNCSFVKCCLMFLVVLYHSVLFYTGSDWFVGKPLYTVDLFKWFADWSHTFRMYAFTLVAGYLYFYLRYEKGKYQQLKAFAINKIKRLIVPYAFICICWVIPAAFFFFGYNSEIIFKKYILATAPNQLWFLCMLFDVFMIVYCLSDWIYKSNMISLFISLAGIVIGAIGGKLFPNVFCIWTGFSYIAYFILGCKIRQYGSDKLNRIGVGAWVAIHTVLYVIVIHLKSINGLLFKISSFGLTVIMQLIGAVMAFLVLQKLAGCVDWKQNKLIKGFSQISMPVFLLHQQLIYFSISLFNGHVNPYVNAIINVAFAIVASAVITKLLYKVKVLRVLMGEKQ